jgi:hypothetical protein
MGMDPEAKLVYGYAFGGDEDSDGWQIEEAGEYGEWEPDWMGDDDVATAAEARLLASVGFTETDYKVARAGGARCDAEAGTAGVAAARRLRMMAANRDQVVAKLNQATTQIENGKDATQATTEFIAECRKSGSAVLGEFADRLEGK